MLVDSTTSVPLLRVSGLFLSLLVVGTLATLPLYKFDIAKFVRTSLFIKIMMWLPIFVIFIGCLYLNTALQFLAVTTIIGLALRDLRRVTQWKKERRLVCTYIVLFSAALFHFPLYRLAFGSDATGFLITICFSSVLADVMAFFMGNYAGKHKLPAVINDRKSWEGVAGQIIGALLGVILVRQFVADYTSLLVFIPIGVGSAVGDLANSFVKRRVGIKEWSNSIPGHGGYLDRFASLGGSLAFAFYWLYLLA